MQIDLDSGKGNVVHTGVRNFNVSLPFTIPAGDEDETYR